LFSKASFATTLCDGPDYKCTTPILSNWIYGTYDSLEAFNAAVIDNFHLWTTGNCPLNLSVAPWGTYFPTFNSVATIGDGSSSRSVILGEGTYYTSVTTVGAVCIATLNGYNTYINLSGFSSIPRRRLMSCPPNFTLYEPNNVSICRSTNTQKKVVVLDPGHGLTCPLKMEKVGSVGVTDFPASNPPAGKLREDYLTVAIALEAEKLLSQKYKVILTKRDVNSCLELDERGRIANKERAKAFVSIHINAPNTIVGIPLPFGNGTSAIYNSESPLSSLSRKLADQTSQAVSLAIGVNNRGVKIDNTLRVLKPKVINMTAVLIEVARLSGSDEQILHQAGSITKAATGIASAVQSYLGN
jgi:N-acetylmuramoyl-L-alanine amidase